MPTVPPTRPGPAAPPTDAPPPTCAAVLVAGSRLLACADGEGHAGTLPHRLAWGGVRVAVLTSVSDASSDDAAALSRLPPGVAVVECAGGDWSACVGRVIAAVVTDPPATTLFLHNDDADATSAAVATAAAHAGVRVVRVASPAAAEIAVAHSHTRAGALLVGVCMRASRERDLLTRGMLPRVCGAGEAPACVFEAVPPGDLARRLADASAPRLDAVLHKVTDQLAAGGSACAGRDAWPQAARALSDAAASVVVVDDVARVMRLADRWATADALQAAGVPTPRSVRVAAGVSAGEALAAIRHAGLTFPIVLKPRAACGTAAAHALAVVLAADGLSAALMRVGGGGHPDTAAHTPTIDAACRCDVLAQQYVDHGGILHKVYVAGSAVHVSRRASVPDLGRGAGGGDPGLHQSAHDLATPATHADDVAWLPFDSTDTAATAAALATTRAATAAALHAAAPPPAPPSAADLEAVVSALGRGLGVTLFGFDGVVDGQSGRLLVVDVNYFPSMGGVPPRAVADAVCAAVADTQKRAPA